MTTKIATLVPAPAPTIHREPASRASMRDEHKAAMMSLASEAANIAGVAARLVQAAQEIALNGGAIKIQPQINYLTGAHMRLVKDWAIVERLQERGSLVRPEIDAGGKRRR